MNLMPRPKLRKLDMGEKRATGRSWTTCHTLTSSSALSSCDLQGMEPQPILRPEGSSAAGLGSPTQTSSFTSCHHK